MIQLVKPAVDPKDCCRIDVLGRFDLFQTDVNAGYHDAIHKTHTTSISPMIPTSPYMVRIDDRAMLLKILESVSNETDSAHWIRAQRYILSPNKVFFRRVAILS